MRKSIPIFGGPGPRSKDAEMIFDRDYPSFIERPEMVYTPMVMFYLDTNTTLPPVFSRGTFIVHRWMFMRTDAIETGFYAYQGIPKGLISMGRDDFPYSNMPKRWIKKKGWHQ